MTDVKIRAMEPEDLDMIYEIENNREIWDVGVTNVPYSRYLLHEYIAGSMGDIFTDKQVRLIITADGKTSGIVDIVNFDPRNRRAEVGIVVSKQFRRMGIATKTLMEIEHYAFRVIHVHTLYAIVPAMNQESVNLFRKVGYEHTATLHEWLYDGEKYVDALMMQRFLEKK
jgi:diamine N-acetyltransferase